ncbi:MAG: threonine/serine exporter family protein [Chloroflexota bacterium]
MSTTIEPVSQVRSTPQVRPHLSRDELRDVLTVSLRAGHLMLESGANTLRVEQTIHQLGTALGAEWLEIYVTPGAIIATDVSYGEHRTRVQRVTKHSIDLSRMAAIVEMTRRTVAGELGYAEVRDRLERIAQRPRFYNRWLTALAVGLGCASFAALFGGGPYEVLIAGIASGLAQLLRSVLLHTSISLLLVTVLVAITASGTALSLASLFAFVAPELAILASVLLLVPGALLVSSVADLFRGDILAGMARGASAVLILTAIGIGLWITLLVSQAQISLMTATPPGLLASSALAASAAIGFAVLFNVRWHMLFFCGLIASLAYSARYGALLIGVPPEAAIFLGGLTIGILSELLARMWKLPTAIFSIPSFIPFVPGVLGFSTVINFVNADYTEGLSTLVRTTLLVGALAAGIGMINALVRRRTSSLL